MSEYDDFDTLWDAAVRVAEAIAKKRNVKNDVIGGVANGYCGRTMAESRGERDTSGYLYPEAEKIPTEMTATTTSLSSSSAHANRSVEPSGYAPVMDPREATLKPREKSKGRIATVAVKLPVEATATKALSTGEEYYQSPSRPRGKTRTVHGVVFDEGIGENVCSLTTRRRRVREAVVALEETESKAAAEASSIRKKLKAQRRAFEAADFVLRLWRQQKKETRKTLTAKTTPVKMFCLPELLRVKARKDSELSGLVITHGKSSSSRRAKESGESACPSFSSSVSTNPVVIKGISSDSIFADTALRMGHELLAINGHRVKDPQRAASMMKRSRGTVILQVSSTALSSANNGRRLFPGLCYARIKCKASTYTAKSNHSSHCPTDHDYGEDSTYMSMFSEDGTMVTSSMPSSDGVGGIGIELKNLLDLDAIAAGKQLISGGLVRVSSIDPSGPFGRREKKDDYAGEDDVLLAVNGEAVQNANHASARLSAVLGHVCRIENENEIFPLSSVKECDRRSPVSEKESSMTTSVGRNRKREREGDGGLIVLLFYPMAVLRVGLLERLVATLPSTWEARWDQENHYRTVSLVQWRVPKQDIDCYERDANYFENPPKTDDAVVMTFVLEFQSDWTCQCEDPYRMLDLKSPETKIHWGRVFSKEIKPLVDKMSECISLVVSTLKEAVKEATVSSSNCSGDQSAGHSLVSSSDGEAKGSIKGDY